MHYWRHHVRLQNINSVREKKELLAECLPQNLKRAGMRCTARLPPAGAVLPEVDTCSALWIEGCRPMMCYKLKLAPLEHSQVFFWYLGWVEQYSQKPQQISARKMRADFKTRHKLISTLFYDGFRNMINGEKKTRIWQPNSRSFVYIIVSSQTLYWKWSHTLSECSGIDQIFLYIHITFFCSFMNLK